MKHYIHNRRKALRERRTRRHKRMVLSINVDWYLKQAAIKKKQIADVGVMQGYCCGC